MTKTLGQIAFEATSRWQLETRWESNMRFHEQWEAAAAAIVEECAKVATDEALACANTNSYPGSGKAVAERIAWRIRSLATPPDAGLKSATRDTVGSEHASASLTQKTEATNG